MDATAQVMQREVVVRQWPTQIVVAVLSSKRPDRAMLAKAATATLTERNHGRNRKAGECSQVAHAGCERPRTGLSRSRFADRVERHGSRGGHRTPGRGHGNRI